MSSRSPIPSWVETFEDLQSVPTVEDLCGVLLEWHGIGSSSAWEEPYLLFMRFHRHDSRNADMTAALLCTDHRWRKAAHHLIDRLAVSDVLGDEQLDVLAECFSGEAFEILVETVDGRRSDQTSIVRRPIWPPLRRWAARHRVSRHPDSWRAVIDASTALPSRDAAATVAGVMDGADHVPLRIVMDGGDPSEGLVFERLPNSTRAVPPAEIEAFIFDRWCLGLAAGVEPSTGSLPRLAPRPVLVTTGGVVWLVGRAR